MSLDTLRYPVGRFARKPSIDAAERTSLIDAISGFTPATGRVRLDDVDLSKAPPVKRARAGVARSFQSLELFEDSTVFENILGERISTKPVEVVNPFPWVDRAGNRVLR